MKYFYFAAIRRLSSVLMNLLNYFSSIGEHYAHGTYDHRRQTGSLPWVCLGSQESNLVSSRRGDSEAIQGSSGSGESWKRSEKWSLEMRLASLRFHRNFAGNFTAREINGLSWNFTRACVFLRILDRLIRPFSRKLFLPQYADSELRLKVRSSYTFSECIWANFRDLHRDGLWPSKHRRETTIDDAIHSVLSEKFDFLPAEIEAAFHYVQHSDRWIDSGLTQFLVVIIGHYTDPLANVSDSFLDFFLDQIETHSDESHSK